MKQINELKANTEIEIFEMPEIKIIGKEIRSGGFLGDTNGELWDACIADKSIDIIKKLPSLIKKSILCWTGNYTEEDDTFSIIEGVFVPLDTSVPKGFTFRILPATLVAKGLYGEKYSFIKDIKEMGYVTNYDLRGWNAEIYFDDDPKGDKIEWTCISPIRKADK